MVNTFLLHTDFRQSARLLDRQRLGKQRVEADQILTALLKYRFLAKYYGIEDFPTDVDTSIEQRQEWVHKVMSTFKSTGVAALVVRNGLVLEFTNKASLPRVAKSGNQLFYDPQTQFMYETSGQRSKVITSGPCHQYVQPRELYIVHNPELRLDNKTNNYYLVPSLASKQWQKHEQSPDLYIVPNMRTGPMINLWLGFEEALKDYVNAHIEVWIERGYNNNMRKHSVKPNYARPKWSYDQTVIDNFKASLIEREIERHEPGWYMHMPDFVAAWAHTQDLSQQFQQVVQQLPVDSWWQYAPANYLLQYGRFPGFIWP